MKAKQNAKKNFLKENLRTTGYNGGGRSPKKGDGTIIVGPGHQSQANISQRGGASTAAGLRARDLSNEKSVSKQ